ncbi:MarR family winged helix-turn-helix transcriptional regulator [Klugiella xanthotipulae]|uniref:DNA-binding MarR family transcriptional regulator n=1 Tax=Klugiella xanthotipulae TaxID=244735 RepID=A0A543HZ64_9MICO|nr:MarR family transcriptional regulator [Klugiella xanthotipulae]TQM63555.1 DNA-binding MarR family transcriptional regulator [Klugiella xanthotipulae]
MQIDPGGERPPARVRPASQHLHRLVELSSEFERGLARELGINLTDLEAMEHLIQDGPLSPGDIARRLGISAASVTIAVDRLSAMGHVSRQPNPLDRRGVLISATPDSRQRTMSVLMPMIFAVDGVLDEFEPEQQATITRYLLRVTDRYQEKVDRLGD